MSRDGLLVYTRSKDDCARRDTEGNVIAGLFNKENVAIRPFVPCDGDSSCIAVRSVPSPGVSIIERLARTDSNPVADQYQHEKIHQDIDNDA